MYRESHGKSKEFVINKRVLALSFKSITLIQVKNIFLLAGQSNMSGLGGVVKNVWDGIVPPECSPSPAILKLDANLQWVEATEP
ncbi:putative carbohydrate esterase [Capsicum chinense]|nr:putative carbohydrate esterase [Capsicum chinense]